MGVEVKVMQCWRCKAYGHRTGDRECPLSVAGNLVLDAERQAREDPMAKYVASTLSSLLEEKPLLISKKEQKEKKKQELEKLLQEIREEEKQKRKKKSKEKETNKNKKEKKKYQISREYDFLEVFYRHL